MAIPTNKPNGRGIPVQKPTTPTPVASGREQPPATTPRQKPVERPVSASKAPTPTGTRKRPGSPAAGEQRRVKRPSAPRPEPATQPAAQKPVETTPEVEEGWAIDPRSGKKYRLLPAAPKDAVKAASKNKDKGLTLDQLRQYTEDVEGFDAEDLTATAEQFLGHLRIPPDKKEIERLRRERIRLAQQRRADQEAEIARLNAKHGDLEEAERKARFDFNN